MPFSAPSSIADFFSRYPDALDVFVVDGGKSYLNHFEAKALAEAKVSGNTLYRIDKNLTVTQVYPELPPVLNTYTGNANIPFDNVEIDGNVVEVEDPKEDLANIEAALEAAATAADVVFESIATGESEGVLSVTIETYQTATIKVGGNTLVLA